VTPLPEDITATTNSEFTLAFGQMAVLTDAGFSIKLIGVGRDQRCPSEIECAFSGPVSVSLLVQAGNETPIELDLQTLTSTDGRSPEMHFEGINNETVYKGYVIRIVSVLPYPVRSFDEIKDSEYHVSFIVIKE